MNHRLQGQKTSPRRVTFLALGTLCVGLGAVGAIVPGLPTTVFLLCASYFFARSSPDAHRWLTEHPRWGSYVRAAESGRMPRRAKVSALFFMWSSILVSAFAIGASRPAILTLIVSLGLVGTVAILLYIRTAEN